MTVRNKNESMFKRKGVILKYIIFCFVLFISLPNLAEDEVIIDENFFKDIDTSKFREKLPPKVEAQDLIDNVFIDRDKDGVDDFLEHVISENKINDEVLIRSVFEYMYLIQKSYEICNLNNSKCPVLWNLKNTYSMKCSRMNKSFLKLTLDERLKISSPLKIQASIEIKRKRNLKMKDYLVLRKINKELIPFKSCLKLEEEDL